MTIFVAPSHQSELPRYQNWLNKRGLKHTVLTYNDHDINCDLLILLGGKDVGTAGIRDEMESKWIKQAIEKNIKIVGICRGLQITNVVMGGTLIQDIKSNISHTSKLNESTKNKDSSFHKIKYNDKLITVNSRHHQSIDKLAEGLQLTARSIDGIVEMVENENMLLVQWHPEFDEVYNTECELLVYDWIRNVKLRKYKGLIINHGTVFSNNIKLFLGKLDEMHYTDFNKDIADTYDYYILSGGPIHISDEDDIKEEKEFLKNCNKPVLGICLGLQILSIMEGCKLKELDKPRNNLYENLGELNMRYEHGWYIDTIPNNYSGIIEDNIVKYIKHNTKPVIAYQGHPELSGESGLKIKRDFIDLLK